MSRTNILKSFGRHVQLSRSSVGYKSFSHLAIKHRSTPALSTSRPPHHRAYGHTSGTVSDDMASTTTVPKHLNFITGNKNKLAEVQSMLL